MGEGFGEHGFAAPWGTVEEDSGGGGEEGGGVSVKVRHGEGIDDGFFEFFDYGVEATNVWREGED